MKDSREITLGAQFVSLLKYHIFSVLVAFVFGITAFWWFLGQPVWRIIFSIIFSLVYLGIVATGAKKIASYDMKEYSLTKASVKKGILLALGLCCITLIIFILYKISWMYMSVNGKIVTSTGRFYNMLFWGWTFPWYGLFNGNTDFTPWYAVISIFTVPFISVLFGYIAGMKNFNLIENLIPFIYENQQKK